MSTATLSLVVRGSSELVAEAADGTDVFRSVLGSLPKGVTVITSESQFGPCGMTVSALCSLSLEPPLVLACLANQSHTLRVIRDSGRFGVNVLSTDQEQVSRQFAREGAGPDKFDDAPHHSHEGVPILSESLAWMVCDTTTLTREGDHTIVIGRARSMRCGEGDPLVWHRGSYRSVA